MPESVALTARLDTAREALVAAKDDFERLRIRDAAAAVKAAAEVVGRRDVQVVAAELVADAERAIAQANPGTEKGGRGKTVNPGLTVSRQTVHAMRQAHKMDDATYEAAKAEARDAGEPITRKALIERNREAAREQKKASRDRVREEAAARIADNPPPPNLIVSPIGDLCGRVDAGSVDAIVTDPPYLTEHVEAGVYLELGEFARHALRPGGLLLTIIPHLHVERVLRDIREAGLDWRWIMAYTQPRAKQKVHSANVTCTWKPWGAWTQPGANVEGYAHDWISATAELSNDKDEHHWGQTKGGVKAVIDEWVKVQGVVCDPFCGAGSTLVAARELGHQVVGADIDPANLELTRSALSK